MSPQNTRPGNIVLGGQSYVIQEGTYFQQLQNPFSPRFATGENDYGDLSYFQYLSMIDFSGGEGQKEFLVSNQFLESENIDVTRPGEFKLTPAIKKLADINGPEKEHLATPIEDEDAWPQIVEWLGRSVIFNDKIEYDGGDVSFLEVFETDIVEDQVINTDGNAEAGVKTSVSGGGLGSVNQKTSAEIVSIDRVQGFPGETVKVTARFTNVQLDIIAGQTIWHMPTAARGEFDTPVRFRIDFGGDGPRQSDSYAYQDVIFNRAAQQFEFIPDAKGLGPQPMGANEMLGGQPANFRFVLARSVIIEFLVKIPNKSAGIYTLWTSVSWKNSPVPAYDQQGNEIDRLFTHQDVDPNTNATVKFFIKSVDTVLVNRKNLYAPQLKAACVVGSKLVGSRTYDGVTYIEVYEQQNGAVDRTLQISLATAAVSPLLPTYIEMVGSNGVIIVALDTRIYKVDIETSGLSDTQRFTFIGIVPGTYVSGMALWNQRVYIGSFDKSLFKSTITWTDLTTLQGSYDIDGKFWITDMANFKDGLFYSGGTQRGEGEIRLFPSQTIIKLENRAFDSRIRTLNAGRLLYGGLSHATGLVVIDENGASRWATAPLEGDEALHVVWGVEEVGTDVYFLAAHGLYKTTQRYAPSGYIETSEFGANTPLIKKIWNSISIEAETMGPGHKARVFVTNAQRQDGQFTLLGEFTQDDGKSKTFTLPTNFEIAEWVKIRVELSTEDDTTTPIIKRIAIKYVPEALQKWQWVMALRCDDHLTLMDGNKDRRSGFQITEDLKALRSGGQLNFTDVDGRQYNVILSDLKFNFPLIDEKRLESIASVELLEI